MILLDTSAWVEFLRATGSPVHHTVRRLLEHDAAMATTGIVVMEVLAGARDADHLARLRRLVLRCEVLPSQDLSDCEAAATLYRECRLRGETVRRLTDCLIAAAALRAHVPVLHADSDFDVLARHTGLRAVRSVAD